MRKKISPMSKTWDEIRGTTQITYKYIKYKYMSLKNLTHLYVISYWKFQKLNSWMIFNAFGIIILHQTIISLLDRPAPTVPITVINYYFVSDNDILNRKQSQGIN
jgi:hypothetical protein